jgi:pimeloyl-ACP methyl ester carboxylesterase
MSIRSHIIGPFVAIVVVSLVPTRVAIAQAQPFIAGQLTMLVVKPDNPFLGNDFDTVEFYLDNADQFPHTTISTRGPINWADAAGQPYTPYPNAFTFEDVALLAQDPNHFAVRFTGSISIPPGTAPNVYTFAVPSDDGFSLDFGGPPFYVNWPLPRSIFGDWVPTLSIIFPDDGGVFPFTLDYFERDGGAIVELAYAKGRYGDFDRNVFALVPAAPLDTRRPQTISFDPLPDRYYHDPPITLAATATSGLPVSFSASGQCTLVGTNVLSLTVPGTCSVTASQAGNSQYLASPQVTQRFVIRDHRPLVFVPGIGGSELKAIRNGSRTVTTSKGDTITTDYKQGDTVWINGAWMTGFSAENNDVLRFQNGAPTFPDFAATSNAVDFAFQGYPALDFTFDELGYTKGVDYFVYGYDWRFDAATASAGLDDLVGRAAGHGQVDILAHSMGTMVTRAFLLGGNNTSKVHRVVFLAGPHVGTPKGALAAIAGVSMGVLGVGIPAGVVKYIFETLPGGLDQAPSRSYYAIYHDQDLQHPVPYADLTTTSARKTYDDLRAVEIASGVETAAILPAEDFHSSDLDWPTALSRANVSLFAGTGKCTAAQVQRRMRRIPRSARTVYYWDFGEVNGDGTVVIGSSSMDSGRAGGANLPVYYRVGTHQDMGSNLGILWDAVRVAQGDPTVTRSGPTDPGFFGCRTVSIHSPMEMLVTDADGSRVGGLDPDERLTEAQDSDFWRFEDLKVAALATGGPFRVNLRGTDSGEAIIKVRTWANELIGEAIFRHVPTTATTAATFTFSSDSVGDLTVDVNGDGRNVVSVSPVLLTGAALNDVTPPVVTIQLPALGQAVVGSFPVIWTATDSGSGVAASEATVSGTDGPFVLAQPGSIEVSPGAHTIDVWAEDQVENSATAHLDIAVDSYSWLPPLRRGFSGKAGRTIPVLFTVVDSRGAFVADPSVVVDLVDSTGTAVVAAIGYGSDPAHAVVVQDSAYHGNLRTDGVAAGSYAIRVRFDSSTLLGTLTLPITLE